MIRLLHGENIVQSRKTLVLATQKAQQDDCELVYLNGSSVSIGALRGALESGSLFGKNRLVVVENLLSTPKSKNKDKILAYLKAVKFDNDLILWEKKEIKGRLPLPQALISLFRLDPILFRFLESLKPNAVPKILPLLSSLKEKEEAEMIFYMLIRQFRYLLIAKDLGTSGLGDLSPWQQQKFTGQARNFQLDQLIETYRKLLEIDAAQKTSTDPYPLASRLDLLIASI